MKYSIRGSLQMADGSDVVNTLNDYILWRLETSQSKDESGVDLFVFEVWVNTPEDKDQLFSELKPFVDQYGEQIDWHECSHDEPQSHPCIIQETYRRE